MNEHSYLTGLSKQDLIRLGVRKMLSEKFDKDVEQVARENEKTKSSNYMKKLIIWLMGLLPVRRRDKNPVIQDLLDNDHHYCKTCGDLYYSANPKQLYCSKACRFILTTLKRKK
jgi:hypothetical protein